MVQASNQTNYRKTVEVLRPREEIEKGSLSEKIARCGHTTVKKEEGSKL